MLINRFWEHFSVKMVKCLLITVRYRKIIAKLTYQVSWLVMFFCYFVDNVWQRLIGIFIEI